MDQTANTHESDSSDTDDLAWFADYLGRSTDYLQRTARAGASLAASWADRSLDDGEWTVDSVTADVIEAWEELTPLTGEGLELYLELVQRALRAGRPNV